MAHRTTDHSSVCGLEETPFAPRVFKESELDTCCRQSGEGKGPRRLPDDLSSFIACASPRTTKAQPAEVAADSPLPRTVQYVLRAHHRPLATRLSNLETLVELVAAAHGNEIEIWQRMARVRKGFSDLRATLKGHLLLEEDILFTRIGTASNRCPCPPEIIQRLKRQHDQVETLATEMLAHAGRLAAHPDACAGQLALYKALKAFKTELETHIRVENEVLFPRALTQLRDEAAQSAG